MVGFLALYYRHLQADFPNYSPWSDWSKFTDEGWYGDAAIRHALFGRWHVPGDFNPGAALPVLPLFESVLFRFTHVGLASVRALAVSFFACSLIALFVLVRRYQSATTAALVVTLLLISPFNFAFMRLAILEPPLILFSILLLLTCSRAQWRRWLALFCCGLLAALVIFTKTTGIVIFPAALYLLWRANHRDRGRFFRSAFVASAVAVVVAASYLATLKTTHHGQDFRYLFSANAVSGLTLHSRWDAFLGALWDGHWAGRWIYPAAWATVLLAVFWLRRMGRNPLFGACVLWVAGYLAFIAWHCNLQPRYYLPILPPLVVLVCMQLEYAWRSRKRVLSACLVLVLLAAVAYDLPKTIHWATHPEYTYRDAAQSLAAVIRQDPQPDRLLMSISGSQITLMTGIRSICDDFGTDDLDYRILRYDPGWYASWDEIDPGTLESLQRFYVVKRVASWPAMDDPERRVLVLWRLVPLRRGLIQMQR
jgi:hypothetical protein